MFTPALRIENDTFGTFITGRYRFRKLIPFREVVEMRCHCAKRNIIANTTHRSRGQLHRNND